MYQLFTSILFGLLSCSQIYAAPHQATPRSPVSFDDSQLLPRQAVQQRYSVNLDASGFQSDFNQAVADGYQLIWLDTYGDGDEIQYAGVYSNAPGPAFVAMINQTAEQYQNLFDTWVINNGYTPTTTSVTGGPGSESFSCIFRNVPRSSLVQHFGLSQSDLQDMTNQLGQSYSLLNFDTYGPAGDRYFVATWVTNTYFDQQTTFFTQDYSQYVDTNTSETSKPYWRNAFLAVSEDETLTSLFTNTNVGGWAANYDMTADELSQQHSQQTSLGRQMVQLIGRGEGANVTFAAIWQEQLYPSPRTMRTRGSSTGFQNNTAALAAIDTAMEDFLRASGTRQSQVSITSGGNILLERAYSWSEPQRATTAPTDQFLLASLSKMFLEAAVQSLFDQGVTTPSFKPFKSLSHKSPWNGPVVDPRMHDITIQQLLDHEGGFNTSASGDPTYSMRQIAQQLNGGKKAVTVNDMVKYMRGRPLDFTPGSVFSYSNVGYLILSVVVQTLTGKDYFQYLEEAVLKPGKFKVSRWPSEARFHVNDRVTQESAYTGLSADAPDAPLPIADIFSGDGMHKEAAYGPAALKASASTLARFAYTHAVWGNGGRSVGAAREGSTPGTMTWVQSPSEQFDFAVTINYREFDNSLFNNLITNVNNFLSSPQAQTA